MGASGQSSFSVTRNNIAAPPFASSSAINGVSIKPVTGEVVLGNDVGATLAALLSNREIPMSNFSVTFTQANGNTFTINDPTNIDWLSMLITNSTVKNRGVFIQFNDPANPTTATTGLRLVNSQTNGTIAAILRNDANRGLQLEVLGTTVAGGDIIRFDMSGNECRWQITTVGGFYRWFTSGATQRMALLANGNLRVAANNTDNTCRLQIDGAGSMDKLVFARNITPYAINLNQDRDNFFTNEGASALIVFNLPSAAANFTYTFYVQDADGLQVTAAAGDTIRIAATVTAAAGNISSTVIGSCIKLQAINATEWVAVSVVGVWVI